MSCQQVYRNAARRFGLPTAGRQLSQIGTQGARARGGQTGQWRFASTSAPGSGSKSGIRGAFGLTLYGLVFTGIGAAGTWQALRSRGMGFYSDEESLKRFVPGEDDEEAKRVEETINSLPMVAELRKRPEMTESRPHMRMPASYREQSLTAGTLQGPNKLVVPPFSWSEKGGKSMVCVSYVGKDLCGHPGIVHGGFLATMLDEGLAHCCMKALPHNICVTANLNIDYRKPAPAGSIMVLRAETTKVEGRKAWVKGHIELLPKGDEKPMVLAEATGLFISPKYAAMMPRIS